MFFFFLYSFTIDFLLFTRSYFRFEGMRRSGEGGETTAGPNDASGIVWALGMFLTNLFTLNTRTNGRTRVRLTFYALFFFFRSSGSPVGPQPTCLDPHHSFKPLITPFKPPDTRFEPRPGIVTPHPTFRIPATRSNSSLEPPPLVSNLQTRVSNPNQAS